MCRLFGFRSLEQGSVHPALVSERNSLCVQSIEHRDGWGIAHYDSRGEPQVARGLGPALGDPDFERVSAGLTALTVVAHLRLASVGAVELRNAHPFIQDRWTFAHNGTLWSFPDHRTALEALIAEDLRSRFTSNTDSERAFFLFLTHLRRAPDACLEAAAHALARTMRDIARVTDEPAGRSAMNFLVTNGTLMLASRRDRSLFFSSRRRDERAEPPRTGQPLHQLVLASEQLSLNQPWYSVADDELIGVDAQLTFHRWNLAEL